MIQASHTRHRRAGFSLVELLISVGILVLLTGLILAGVIRARKIATETRVRDDLALLSTALEAYKGDCEGEYPHFADPATDQASSTLNGNGTWLDYTNFRGAVLLCRALVGSNAGGTSAIAAPGDDGADGPGFRKHRVFNSATGMLSGKVFGPYGEAAKFKITYVGSTPNIYPVLVDGSGNAILYYPAAPGNQVTNLGYNDPKLTNINVNSRFNGYDNQAFVDAVAGGSSFSANSPFATLAAGCGSPGFLLWTAGADGQFGLINGKTDDIANFDMPANLKK